MIFICPTMGKFLWQSNPGRFVCKAGVITATLWNHNYTRLYLNKTDFTQNINI